MSAVLGIDTATAATAAAVLRLDGEAGEAGEAVEARHDPGPGGRPEHAGRLLGLVEQVLAEAQVGWGEVGRLAVGVGPGGFTGLRIGIATARGLAQARGLPVVGVGSLHALAAGAPDVAAVLDARRREVYAAVWCDGALVLGPAALAPAELAARLPAGLRAVGEGALAYRSVLEAGGAEVPPDEAPEHRLSAAAICRLGAGAPLAPLEALLPDYRRDPDATPAR